MTAQRRRAHDDLPARGARPKLGRRAERQALDEVTPGGLQGIGLLIRPAFHLPLDGVDAEANGITPSIR